MEEILIEDYNYPLPDERIAKYPLPQRDQSKLLVYHNGQIEEDSFCHIGNHLSDGSLLVYNNTRVIQARLEFHKKGVQDFKGAGVTTALNSSPIAYEPSDSLNNEAPKGARIEVFCLEPMMPHDYQLALGSTESCTWKCMIGNAKKWKSGTLSLPVTLVSGQEVTLFAKKGKQTGNTFEVSFSWTSNYQTAQRSDNEVIQQHSGPIGAVDLNISFAEILDAVGELPIPPYLNRKTEESDKTTYQTVYSRIKGSVAAPTAGLHFTNNVLDGLRQRGIHTAEVTLHVGAGTFQPVKTADANQHTMHTEIIAVPRDTITTLIDNLGHIVAVGTTSMRTLESLYFLGEQLHTTLPTPHTVLSVAQFAPYMSEHTLSTGEALQAIVDYLDSTGEDVLHAETQIMIRPGYTFRIVDKLITNFHQPKSTLLLLVSAFVGGDWHTIYDYALAHNFRFLSYGDSSILTRSDYSRH
jgi:S-adenosylmethionine:tRNA ribosyltransferase-isomerase